MTPQPFDVEALRALIASRLGIAFDETRTGSLAEILDRRARAAGVEPGRYVGRVRDDVSFGKRELSVLAREITVGETYFFRDIDQLRAFREVVLPERAARGGPVRILCAGCASGEEPYTLAIIARERAGIDVAIRAVDLNPAALEKAARLRYSSWSLREIPPNVRDTWFRRDGDEFVLDAQLARFVRFEERNIAERGATLFEPGSFDVVFCRNVLMYFTPAAARAAVTAIARSLAPDGYLFLGHAETLRGLSNDFHLRHTHGTFYYQRRELDHAQPFVERPVDAPLLSAPVDESWVEIIHDATQRVRTMTTPTSDDRVSSPNGRVDLSAAIELLRSERFSDAVAAIRAMPSATADGDALLLEAILLTQTGDLGSAERACEQLLQLDEMSAGAHYVLALCREAAGDLADAAEHDRIASYLDPSFAMPLFHLGLLARRQRDLELSRTALGRALVLLGQEDASRILLFGGGFGRDALVSICRTELAGLEGR